MLSRFRHIAAAAAATVSPVAAAAPAAHAFTPAPTSAPSYQCAINHCVWVGLHLSGTGSGHVTMTNTLRALDDLRDTGMDCVGIEGQDAGMCYALVQWPADVKQTAVFWTAEPTPNSVACDVRIGDDAKNLGNCTSTAATIRTGAFLLDVDDPRIVEIDGKNYFRLSGRFEKAMRTLVVTKSGTGGGHIDSDAGIACGATCTTTVVDGTKVTLTAHPQTGVRFRQWTGACYGQGATCTLTLDQDMETDAVFELAGQGDGGTQPSTSTGGSTAPHAGGSGTAPGGSSGAHGSGTAPSGSSVNPGNLALRTRLLSLRTAHGRHGRQRVSLALTTMQRASVDLTLSRGRSVIAHRRADVPDGGGALSLTVPAKVHRGRASLVVRVHSGDGAVRTFTRTVRLG